MKKFLLSLFCLSFFLSSFSIYAFSDLQKDHENYSALMFLKEKGIINGYEDGTVKPNNKINRAELVKILVEGLNHIINKSEDKNCFPDVKEEWFAKYICYAKRQNWIDGYPDGLFHPERNINRAEALKIIINSFQFVVLPSTQDPFNDVKKDIWFAPFVTLAKEKNLLPESGDTFGPNKLRTRGEVAEIISRIIKTNNVKEDKFKDWPSEWTTTEMDILKLINRLRAEDGKAPLVLNPFLTKSAREHSKDMAENLNNLQHEGSNGSTAGDRIKNSGAQNIHASAENIGSGTFNSDSRSVYDVVEDVHINIFMEEPETGFNHKTTLLSRSFPFTEVGIGVYVRDNTVYFTTDFISIQGK